jgi:hypothetical protein
MRLGDSVPRVSRPTQTEIERGIAALLPFAQEWGLPLNPEDLQAMAVAVLIHAHSDETLHEIDAAERRWIKGDREDRSRVGLLSDEELTIIEARAAAATPGPWESFVEGRDHHGGDNFVRTGGLDDTCPDLYLSPASVEDQDFIAHARQDVPRLVAEVRRLRRLASDQESRSPGGGPELE